VLMSGGDEGLYKLGLAFGLIIGVIAGLVASGTVGVLGLPIGIVAGAVSGCTFGFTSGLVNVIAVRLWSEFLDGRSVRQLKTIIVKDSFDAVFDRCLSSMEGLAELRVVRIDRLVGIIQARRRMTWKTFGDEITIQVSSINHIESEVKIESRPWMRTT